MPPIVKALFSGDGNISGEELALLEICDYGDSVQRTLREFKWNNKPVSAVALELSPVNRHVNNGTFLVRGPLEAKEIKVKTSNLWATAAADTQLTVRVPDGSTFAFNVGSLCSNYLACDETTHVFTRAEEGEAPAVIMAGELQNYGVGEFCLRLVCHITCASVKTGVGIHFTVLTYLGSRDKIMEMSEQAECKLAGPTADSGRHAALPDAEVRMAVNDTPAALHRVAMGWRAGHTPCGRVKAGRRRHHG